MYKICYIVTIPETIKAFFIPQLRYLSENGFDVTVICNDDPVLGDLLGEKITFIPMDVPRTISVKRLFSVIMKMKKLFSSEKYDIVQYSTLGASVSGAVASLVSGIIIRNYHVMGFRFVDYTGIKKLMHKFMEIIPCIISTDIECVSLSNLRMAVREKMFPKEKGTVVYNGSTGGIDLQKFSFSKRGKYREEIRRKYKIDATEYVFGFVGRLCRDKGINEILTAFLKLSEKFDGYRLLMVGDMEKDNDIDPELYTLSKNNKSIIYTGSVNNVERYYSAIDVLLLPTYHEGFGNVIIEAAAMGTPSIVSEIPGPIDATIKNVTALWIKSHSSEELYNAMLQIKGMESKMGLESVSFVTDHFDQETLNRHILKRKTELLKKHHKNLHD